jgi:hypothetical protein
MSENQKRCCSSTTAPSSWVFHANLYTFHIQIRIISLGLYMYRWLIKRRKF